jgi:hypothetical protein
MDFAKFFSQYKELPSTTQLGLIILMVLVIILIVFYPASAASLLAFLAGLVTLLKKAR